MTEVWEVLKWTIIVVGWIATPIVLLTLAWKDLRAAIKYRNNDYLVTRYLWSGTLYGIVGISFPIAAIIATIRYFVL
jgi:hypothetical protein